MVPPVHVSAEAPGLLPNVPPTHPAELVKLLGDEITIWLPLTSGSVSVSVTPVTDPPE